MKKLFLPLVAAILMAGTTAPILAATGHNSHHAIAKKLPDSGYDFGYKAGQRYANGHPSEKDLGLTWHNALCTSASYASSGDQGRADYWQGYADALNYFDNNTYPCY